MRLNKTKTTSDSVEKAKLAAAAAFFEKYKIPPLSKEDIERIEAEWQKKPERSR